MEILIQPWLWHDAILGLWVIFGVPVGGGAMVFTLEESEPVGLLFVAAALLLPYTLILASIAAVVGGIAWLGFKAKAQLGEKAKLNRQIKRIERQKELLALREKAMNAQLDLEARQRRLELQADEALSRLYDEELHSDTPRLAEFGY